jgi:hypothetical protein
MFSTRIDEPGYPALSIDGVLYALPKEFTPADPLRLTQSLLASGGTSLMGAFAGAGMPDMIDAMTMTLSWDIDENFGALCGAIELLRASGGEHDVAYWKRRAYSYTLAAEQQVIFLPRRDAFKAGYAFIEDDDAVTAQLNGADLVVVYKPAVADADDVPAGELWVSEAAIDHPESRKPNVVRCKCGSAIEAGDEVILQGVPLFRMRAIQVDPVFSPGIEDKTVVLIEVD